MLSSQSGTKFQLHHRTEYRYDRAVSLGPQVIQLHPAPHCRTPILGYSLQVEPAAHTLHSQFDSLGNRVARVLVPGKTDAFVIDVELTADLTPYNPFDFFLEPGFESYPFTYAPEVARNLQPYLQTERAGRLLREFLDGFDTDRQGTVDLLVALNGKVRDAVAYTTRFEHGVQSCEETLAEGTGSCRDSAWLLVQCLRHLGVAARFVSGYLIQLKNDEPSSGEDFPAEPVRTTDTAELHAWAEAFLPGAGWIGLDATSGLLTAEGHIPLAVAANAAWEAAPVGGTVERAAVDFRYTFSVERVVR